MSQGQVTVSHTLASPQRLSRSKKAEITSFSQTLVNTNRYSSIPSLDRANVRPPPVSSLCHLSIPLSPPHPLPILFSRLGKFRLQMSGFVIASYISTRRGVQNPTRQVGRRRRGRRTEGRKEGVQVGKKSKKDEEERKKGRASNAVRGKEGKGDGEKES